MDLHQIHREDVFGPLYGRVWMSRSKVKVTGDKKSHCALPSHPAVYEWSVLLRDAL